MFSVFEIRFSKLKYPVIATDIAFRISTNTPWLWAATASAGAIISSVAIIRSHLQLALDGAIWKFHLSLEQRIRETRPYVFGVCSSGCPSLCFHVYPQLRAINDSTLSSLRRFEIIVDQNCLCTIASSRPFEPRSRLLFCRVVLNHSSKHRELGKFDS